MATKAVPTRWRPVAALALEALKGSAKDLEVATWLTEALVRTEGLAGLSAGARHHRRTGRALLG